MKAIKYMLLIGVAVGLSACEMAPVGDESGRDSYVAPNTTSPGLSLNPRAYMDDSNPNLQRMLSSFDRSP